MGESLGREHLVRMDEDIRKVIDRYICEFSLTTMDAFGVLMEIALDVWHQDYHRSAEEPSDAEPDA